MRQDENKQKDIIDSIENTDITQYPLECSCDSYIREGNRFYLVLSKCSEGWDIEDTVCDRCSVRDSLERIQPECQKAVVQATLRRPERVSFKNPKLMEFID